MGILNRTPDSFYDQGATFALDLMLRRAEAPVAEGADILDVGGVKAGPGPPVGEEEELDRVVPASRPSSARFDVPVSADTWNAKVLAAACAAGAVVGNDISGFGDPDYLPTAARAGATVVATHIRLAPRVRDPEPRYDDLVADVAAFLVDRAERARTAGLAADQIVLDAGLDLGKTAAQSAVLLRESERLAGLGYPLLLSASNKTFLGVLLDRAVDARRAASLTAVAYGVSHGWPDRARPRRRRYGPGRAPGRAGSSKPKPKPKRTPQSDATPGARGGAVSTPGARAVPVNTGPVHLVSGTTARFRADATKALVVELLGNDDPSLALEEFSLAARADGGEGDAAPAGDGPSIVDRALSSASTPALRHRAPGHRDPRGGSHGGGRRRHRGPLTWPIRAPPRPWSSSSAGGASPVALTKAVKAAGGQEVRTAPAKTGRRPWPARSTAPGLKLTPAAARRVSRLVRSTTPAGSPPSSTCSGPPTARAPGSTSTNSSRTWARAGGGRSLPPHRRDRQRRRRRRPRDPPPACGCASFHPLQVMALLHKQLPADAPARRRRVSAGSRTPWRPWAAR